MHARVSPLAEHFGACRDLPVRALECAEEYRVNALLSRTGFDVGLLADGSEKAGGRSLAAAGEWAEAACFFVAVAGTGAERAFLAGVRQVRPEWAKALRILGRRVEAVVASLATDVMASTRSGEDELPVGFGRSTLEIARVLARVMDARVPVSTEELRTFRRSLEPGGRRPVTGRFALLVVDPRPSLVEGTGTSAIRRPRPSVSGTTLRYPGRLVFDARRRAFSTRVTRRAGVVVIDQSGSMEIDPGEITRLLRHAPGSLVVGYSHRPGDHTNAPNAWVLARRGCVASDFPVGNVGNGVDGPVLRWAASMRRRSEPLVWVTDGQVTDSNDYPDPALTDECAQLVRLHRIRLVRRVSEVEKVLRQPTPMTPFELRSFGRVGRRLGELRLV